MDHKKIRDIILLSIIGDALGSTCEGLSRGHIRSLTGNGGPYFDPPVKKINVEKWRKPGLYTSISQLMLLMALSRDNGTFSPGTFIKIIGESPKPEGGPYGIFRHPGHGEAIFLDGIFTGREGPGLDQVRSSRILPLMVPLALGGLSREELIFQAASTTALFSRDTVTVSAGIHLASLIHRLAGGETIPASGIIPISLHVNRESEAILEKIPSRIFNLKINPDRLIECTRHFSETFAALEGIRDREAGEEIISVMMNRFLKTHVKKCTVDNPMAILPFSLLLVSLSGDSPQDLLPLIARQGGSASSLASISGALLGCSGLPEPVPERLIKDLVNKKMIISAVESIARGKIPASLIQDFYKSETGLTKKELEEYRARQKRKKGGDKEVKPQRDRDRDLSRHIVESWTKIDKAKWKKKRKNLKDDGE